MVMKVNSYLIYTICNEWTIIEIQDYLHAFKKALDSIYIRLQSLQTQLKMPHYRNHIPMTDYLVDRRFVIFIISLRKNLKFKFNLSI
jgi:hypothetical protein